MMPVNSLWWRMASAYQRKVGTPYVDKQRPFATITSWLASCGVHALNDPGWHSTWYEWMLCQLDARLDCPK